MDEAKNQINDLEHKEAKTTNRKEVKRIQKKQGLCKKPLEQLQAIQHLHHRCRKEKRKSKKLERNPNTNLKEHKHPYDANVGMHEVPEDAYTILIFFNSFSSSCSDWLFFASLCSKSLV